MGSSAAAEGRCLSKCHMLLAVLSEINQPKRGNEIEDTFPYVRVFSFMLGNSISDDFVFEKLTKTRRRFTYRILLCNLLVFFRFLKSFLIYMLLSLKVCSSHNSKVSQG